MAIDIKKLQDLLFETLKGIEKDDECALVRIWNAYVDNTGQVIETSNYVDSVAGNDVYLTIDKDLTEACYNIIEQSLAGILVSKIQNVKEYQKRFGMGGKDVDGQWGKKTQAAYDKYTGG